MTNKNNRNKWSYQGSVLSGTICGVYTGSHSWLLRTTKFAKKNINKETETEPEKNVNQKNKNKSELAMLVHIQIMSIMLFS